MERNHVLLPAPSLRRRLPPQQWVAVGGSEPLAAFPAWRGAEGSTQVQPYSESPLILRTTWTRAETPECGRGFPSRGWGTTQSPALELSLERMAQLVGGGGAGSKPVCLGWCRVVEGQ